MKIRQVTTRCGERLGQAPGNLPTILGWRYYIMQCTKLTRNVASGNRGARPQTLKLSKHFFLFVLTRVASKCDPSSAYGELTISEYQICLRVMRPCAAESQRGQNEADASNERWQPVRVDDWYEHELQRVRSRVSREAYSRPKPSPVTGMTLELATQTRSMRYCSLS